ncbi:MAG TPA: 3-carboxyethylcatechol 2,3-dioxygenase [Acidimicrobiales bacterium]|nr:3-carboxyethylcatechol 2,3-dioxygenase [Acidimicrobiales bacterium]
MALALCCLSHSPLIGIHDPDPEVRAAVDAAVADAADRVAAFDPDLVVVFAPDHLNGFLYRLMPQFCIGTAGRAIGDFGSAAGDLSVDADAALDCAEAVLAADVDVALSLDMTVDHGFAQPLALVLGGIAERPVVPVFVNAAGAPRSRVARSRALGAAVGRWAAALDRRVLLMGSGGLSHDAPTPALAGATPELRHRLIEGITTDARRARESSVVDVARQHAAGSGPLLALAPDFDSAFMDMMAEGRLDEVEAWRDEWLSANFGRSVHEVRTWVAAFAALAAAGPYVVRSRFYRAIPEWIVGYGLMTAVQDAGGGPGTAGTAGAASADTAGADTGAVGADT